MVTDTQAREILLQYERDPKNLHAVQSLLLALTNYGQGIGAPVETDNNWFGLAVTSSPSGACSQGSYTISPGVCERIFATPQEGITAGLLAWFPQQSDGTAGPAGAAFYQALQGGDVATLAAMAMQRTWGLPALQKPWDQSTQNAFIAGIMASSQRISAAFGEPSHLRAPTGFSIKETKTPVDTPTDTPIDSPPAKSPPSKQNSTSIAWILGGVAAGIVATLALKAGK